MHNYIDFSNIICTCLLLVSNLGDVELVGTLLFWVPTCSNLKVVSPSSNLFLNPAKDTFSYHAAASVGSSI